MKIRDFFILIIKLFGLYSLVITVFNILPTTLPYIISTFAYSEFYFDLIIVFLLIAFMIVLTYILMKKAGKVVDFLKINHGFEVEEINFGMLSDKAIVKIAFIILGTYLFVEELPYFIRNTLDSINFKTTNDYLGEDETQYFPWIVSLIKLFVGLILMFNYKQIQERLFKTTESPS